MLLHCKRKCHKISNVFRVNQDYAKKSSTLAAHDAIVLAQKFKCMIMRQEAVSLSKCWPLFVEHLQTAVFQRLKLKLIKNDMCKLILHFDLATYELKSF